MRSTCSEKNPGLSFRMADVFPDIADGSVDATKQGGIQALSLAITLGIALLGGLIVGKDQGSGTFWRRTP